MARLRLQPPGSFACPWRRYRAMLEAEGRDPTHFPSTMATTWSYVTDDAGEARAMLERTRPDGPAAGRRSEGPVADRLPRHVPTTSSDATGMAGLQRVLVWPMANEVGQLEGIAERRRALHLTRRSGRAGSPGTPAPPDPAGRSEPTGSSRGSHGHRRRHPRTRRPQLRAADSARRSRGSRRDPGP